MKGLLKGLRYISRMFGHEREPEIQIGMPTDVQHVAHIGWDGPSAAKTAPSWMNEFQTPAEGLQSTPTPQGTNKEYCGSDVIRCISADSQRMSRKNSRGKSSSTRDKPELPKSSKSTTTSSINGLGSSTKEKTDKAKQSKKTRKPKDPNQATESTSKDPKKNSRRKKLKDLNGEGSSGRHRTVQDLDTVSETESQYSCTTDFVESENT